MDEDVSNPHIIRRNTTRLGRTRRIVIYHRDLKIAKQKVPKLYEEVINRVEKCKELWKSSANFSNFPAKYRCSCDTEIRFQRANKTAHSTSDFVRHLLNYCPEITSNYQDDIDTVRSMKQARGLSSAAEFDNASHDSGSGMSLAAVESSSPLSRVNTNGFHEENGAGSSAKRKRSKSGWSD